MFNRRGVGRYGDQLQRNKQAVTVGIKDGSRCGE